MEDHTADSPIILIPLRSRKYPGMFAVVDADDAPRVMQFNWRAVKDYNTFYAYRRIPLSQRGTGASCQAMHRLILDANPGTMVDHANQNGLDNRRENIRIATNSQNQANGCHRKNASGFRGVRKSGSRWAAQIRSGGKPVRLGTFDTAIAAANAYDTAAREVFGEFATTNFEG
jgi:hypothetical protein